MSWLVRSARALPRVGSQALPRVGSQAHCRLGVRALLNPFLPRPQRLLARFAATATATATTNNNTSGDGRLNISSATKATVLYGRVLRIVLPLTTNETCVFPLHLNETVRDLIIDIREEDRALKEIIVLDPNGLRCASLPRHFR